MLIGNPDKFAFLLEIVPEWSDDTFINGMLYVFINGAQYPKTLRTTTLSDDIYYLVDNSSFIHPKINDELFSLDAKTLFKKLCEITFPSAMEDNNDFDYLIPLTELSSEKYQIYIVSSKMSIKILVGHYINNDQIYFDDEVLMDLEEFEVIKQKMQNYYLKYIKQ